MAYKVSKGRWVPAKHLIYTSKLLVDAAVGRIKRLIITEPPRHGKSELVSKYTPAWYEGMWPDNNLILTSYESDFAASWGRKARDILEEHGESLFGIRLGQKAANSWTIEGHEGGMNTAGAGAAITGKGGQFIIVDDPFKNAEEANSPTMRNKVWDWYQSTLYTRLEPNGSLVIVQTRWHEDDLVGRLLNPDWGPVEDWTILNLPALAEEDDPLGRAVDEPLWPERYDREELERIRATIGSYWWASLYQQRPTPRGGGMFRREWLGIVDQAPADMAVVRYWDLAGTEASKQGQPDYTVGAQVGIKDGIYYILDIRRDQMSPKGVQELVRQTAEMDGRDVPVYMEQEPGSSGKNTIDLYARLILPGFTFRGDRKTGSKVQAAETWAAAAEAGNVKLVRGPWNREFLDEVQGFPHGKHDDQVDAVSGGVNKLFRPKARVRAKPRGM